MRFPQQLALRRQSALFHQRRVEAPSHWMTRFVAPFLAAVLTCALLDANFQDGWGFNSLEFYSYEARAKWRRHFHPTDKSGQPVVIVTISDSTFSDPEFEHLHGPPISRDYHARIIRTLTRAGAKVIAFDLLFDIPRPEDKLLAVATAKSNRVAWACALSENDRFIAPSPLLLQASRRLGHIEVPHHDSTPAVHRIKPFLEDFRLHPSMQSLRARIGERVPALSLRIAMMSMGLEHAPIERFPGRWQVGDLRVPVDRDGYFLIDYQGKPDEVFPTVDYEDLFTAENNPDTAAFYRKFFENKIVLVGDTSKIGNDLLYTPMGTMWGVEAQAHAVASFLQRYSLFDAPQWLNVLTIALLSAVVCLSARLRRLRHMMMVTVSLSVGYLAFNAWIFIEHAISLHLVAPMTALAISTVGVLIQRGFSEERDKDVMFDSLVLAAASAIEDRDPSTSGHSQRVTLLTVELAKAVSQSKEEPFRNIFFNASQLRELNYAGMLHDFGKIGVRENILTKSHKLEPAHFQTVKGRLLLQRLSMQHDATLLKLDALMDIQHQGGTVSDETWRAFEAMDRQLEESVRNLNDDLERLERANDPLATFLPDPEYQALCILLDRLEGMNYEDEYGVIRPLITAEEKEALKIRKGSLTVDEYKQVQRHAEMSYNFLRQIPWTQDLSNIPDIARAHHEKLNGSGYPQGLKADQIPIEARIMTIADIYDALTAADRAYKKAMPAERALSILRSEAEAGCLDMDLLNLFIDQEVYKVTVNQPPVDLDIQTAPAAPATTPGFPTEKKGGLALE